MFIFPATTHRTFLLGKNLCLLDYFNLFFFFNWRLEKDLTQLQPLLAFVITAQEKLSCLLLALGLLGVGAVVFTVPLR